MIGEQKRFRTRLGVLAEKGLKTGLPIMDFLEENLFELRLEHSPHNPRFLFCTFVGRNIYLLHGFSKTGKANDKVPEFEKRIARARREKIEERERKTKAELEALYGKNKKVNPQSRGKQVKK